MQALRVRQAQVAALRGRGCTAGRNRWHACAGTGRCAVPRDFPPRCRTAAGGDSTWDRQQRGTGCVARGGVRCCRAAVWGRRARRGGGGALRVRRGFWQAAASPRCRMRRCRSALLLPPTRRRSSGGGAAPVPPRPAGCAGRPRFAAQFDAARATQQQHSEDSDEGLTEAQWYAALLACLPPLPVAGASVGGREDGGTPAVAGAGPARLPPSLRPAQHHASTLQAQVSIALVPPPPVLRRPAPCGAGPRAFWTTSCCSPDGAGLLSSVIDELLAAKQAARERAEGTARAAHLKTLVCEGEGATRPAIRPSSPRLAPAQLHWLGAPATGMASITSPASPSEPGRGPLCEHGETTVLTDINGR